MPFLAMLLLFTVSCRNKTVKNPISVGSVGTPWEVLVVMDKADWEAPHGRALFEVLDRDVPCLPQSEPMFQISRCNVSDFTGILKPVRNIIQVEISNIYSAPKAYCYQDLWASNQSVLKLVAPDKEQFETYVREHPEVIYNYFEQSELKRNLDVIRRTYNREFSQIVEQKFGIRILVPKLMKQYKLADDFFWASNAQAKKRQDMVIYTYPYTDPNTFTEEYLLHKRDSVMKENIPGGPAGSYMARQEDVPGEFRALNLNGKYAAEIRGLWKVKGDMMGGPFVSVTRLDEVNQRVVTVEVFVYAPEDDKRNILRYNESIIYSMKLPGEFRDSADKN